jgi:hypothetical protein
VAQDVNSNVRSVRFWVTSVSVTYEHRFPGQRTDAQVTAMTTRSIGNMVAGGTVPVGFVQAAPTSCKHSPTLT